MDRKTLSTFALLTLGGASLGGCTFDPDAAMDWGVCEVAPCTDGGDLDGDGVLDCADADMDGDGLRNVWDASPSDAAVAEVLPGGLGADGALIVDQPMRLEVERTVLIGAAAAGATQLTVQDASAFGFGDEILVLSAQGEGAGGHAHAYIASIDGETLTVEPPLAADLTGDVVLVQRVPGYTSVHVTETGSLSAPAWDGLGGGVLALRAIGDVVIAGQVQVDAAGFTGAPGVASWTERASAGEGWMGLADEGDDTLGAANASGGGGAVALDGAVSPAASGGGGGYGTDGDFGRYEDDIEASAEGGWAVGDAELSLWFYGSGGGAGAPDSGSLDGQRAGNVSGGGGAGGGVVMLFSEASITVSGTISADGEAGEAATSVGAELGGGGGGSGGQIYLGAPVLTVDAQVSAQGGQGGSAARSTPDNKGTELVCDAADTRDCVTGRGGEGGEGRIRLDRREDGGGAGVVSPDPFIGEFPSAERFPCDADGDGVWSAACLSEPSAAADCDDARADVFPGAPEVQGDGVDQDCDGADTCVLGVVNYGNDPI